MFYVIQNRNICISETQCAHACVRARVNAKAKMFLFASLCIHSFATHALLSCTNAGPIKQINLRDWMKGERIESMTAKREREDENDRRPRGTVKRLERKKEREKAQIKRGEEK